MSDERSKRDDGEYPMGVTDDNNVEGDYNMEIVAGKNSLLTKARPVPVFGMRHVSWQGANPNHATPGPRSKKLTESEVRELILRHGLDTQGFIAELKRLVEIGAIPMSPENLKKIVDAEKGNAETLLRALDKTNSTLQLGDAKSIALQIINNVAITVDKGFQRASERMKESPVIEANVVAVKTIEATKDEQILQIPNENPADELEAFVMAKRG